jgi:hypothetical protein
MTTTGLNIAYQFQYDNSAELTQVTTPLGGALAWSYRSNAYATRTYREVQYRYMQATSSSAQNSWSIWQDSNSTWHGQTFLTDNGAGTYKNWYFSTASDYTAGLATSYEEIAPSGAWLLEKAYAWGQSSSGNPYVSQFVNTLNPGASYAASTTTYQTVDAYGNLTQQQIYDYAGSLTGNRTYNMTYTASN